jgi:hypothetical protein
VERPPVAPVEVALVVAVTVASAETAVKSAAVVVTTPPLEEPVTSDLELVSSHTTSFSLAPHLGTIFLSIGQCCTRQGRGMSSPNKFQ